ncbi:undecaprenyl-phosphate alpha-N-acetylglucosaminyl 1-phosphate transferase, partial [Candidatus Peregrinibacteria bacterium CG11_big_fil_rev_8_21_14_0_20_46_8]
ICDLFSVMLRRIQKKKSPFQAGREHLHHIFISAKFNNIATTIIIGLISCAFGGIGLLLEYTKINSGYSFIIFIGVFVTYYLLMRKA